MWLILIAEKQEKGKKLIVFGRRDLQDGGEVRRGDQLPPHKYIRNTSTCGTTPTEHLLNVGRRPQTSQKCGWQGLGALAGCQA